MSGGCGSRLPRALYGAMPVTSSARVLLMLGFSATVGSFAMAGGGVSAQPCAADYNSTKPCCGQDPHEKNPVPVVDRCPATSPICHCYIYGHHLGFCAKSASKDPCPTPPPPPPPPPAPPPCPTSGKPVDIEWLSCRTEQIIKGCVENILPTSPLNKGINGKVVLPAINGAQTSIA